MTRAWLSMLSLTFIITYHCERMPPKRDFFMNNLLVKQTASRLSEQSFCFYHRRATGIVSVCPHVCENAFYQNWKSPFLLTARVRKTTVSIILQGYVNNQASDCSQYYFHTWISVYEPLCRGKGAGKQRTASFACKKHTRHSVVRAQIPLKMCLNNGNLSFETSHSYIYILRWRMYR